MATCPRDRARAQVDRRYGRAGGHPGLHLAPGRRADVVRAGVGGGVAVGGQRGREQAELPRRGRAIGQSHSRSSPYDSPREQRGSPAVPDEGYADDKTIELELDAGGRWRDAEFVAAQFAVLLGWQYEDEPEHPWRRGARPVSKGPPGRSLAPVGLTGRDSPPSARRTPTTPARSGGRKNALESVDDDRPQGDMKNRTPARGGKERGWVCCALVGRLRADSCSARSSPQDQRDRGPEGSQARSERKRSRSSFIARSAGIPCPRSRDSIASRAFPGSKHIRNTSWYFLRSPAAPTTS